MPSAPAEDPLEVQRVVAQAKLALLGEREQVVLGRYEIEHWLGSGAFGTVYACRDPAMGRRVAVKVLRTGHHGGGHLDDALLREARAQARIDHANVLGVLDVGRADGRAFVVMPLIEGGDLAAWVRRETPTPPQLVEAIAQAGDGLAAAHAAGLVHCDVKATNLLRTAEGQTVVADFGIATRSGDRRRGGTPRTMAPEQRLGLAIDGRADQFSLALVLVEQWTGSLPALESQSIAGVDRRVSTVVRRALHIDPTARFDSMDAFVAALRDAMRPRRVPVLATIAGATIGVAVLALATPTAEPVVFATEPTPTEGPDVRYRRPELERAARAITDSRLEEAEALLTEALGRPDPPLDPIDRADALYLSAQLAIFSGDDKLATQRFESAYSRAVVARHARVAVESAGMLAGYYTERGLPEQGQRWLAQGRAEVRRSGDAPPLLLGWLLVAGGLDLSADRFDAALEKLERAAALSKQPGAATVARRISLRRALAIALQAKERYAEAEVQLREALALAEADNGLRSLQRAWLLDVLAVAVARQGRQDEGIDLAVEALDIAGEVHGEASPATIDMQMNLAKHHFMAGHTDRAIELQTRAIDMLAETDPESLVLDRARISLAEILRGAGRLTEAREAAMQALVGIDAGDHRPAEAEFMREELAAIDAAIAAKAAAEADAEADAPLTDASR